MYTLITKRRAYRAAARLIANVKQGYGCFVIDDHWEFDIEMSDTKPNTGVVRIYERLDDNTGQIHSCTYDAKCEIGAIAIPLMNHINDCVREWFEQDLIMAIG